MFSFQMFSESFGNISDVSGPPSVEAHSVIVVIFIKGRCQSLSRLSHEYFRISDVCVGINIFFSPDKAAVVATCQHRFSQPLHVLQSWTTTALSQHNVPNTASFPPPPPISLVSLCSWERRPSVCRKSPMSYFRTHWHGWTQTCIPQESQNTRIPNGVNHGNPLLHIRGGQRTYLLGQSNYKGICVLDLCTPSGKGNISGENRAGAGADIHFTIGAVARISIDAWLYLHLGGMI